MPKIEMENYMKTLIVKNNVFFPDSSKLLKIDKNEFDILNIHNYVNINKRNYTISQLKLMTKYYNLTSCGSKKLLVEKIYFHLHNSFFAVKIQKMFRGFLQRKFNQLFGPALKTRNRALCTNTTDFITMEDVVSIPYARFYSFKDIDNFIYGFELPSIYKLMFDSKCLGKKTNPYNRNQIPNNVEYDLMRIVHISKILKIPVSTKIELYLGELSKEKLFEMRTLKLFQTISSFGIISFPEWFLSLSREKLIYFIHNLYDVWFNRSELTRETKQKICFPSGNPFNCVNMQHIYTSSNLFYAKKNVLDILEKMVYNGIDNEHKTLGCYYLIGSLTLVNNEAALSFPWLFESFN